MTFQSLALLELFPLFSWAGIDFKPVFFFCPV